MNYSGIINCSIVDGVGFRVALYVSGCKHKCHGCHNLETWDFKSGKPYTDEVEGILFDRIDQPYIKGLTLTGGDPMFSAKEVKELLVRFRERFGDTKDVWLYTGFTLNKCVEKGGDMADVINMCDYVVDGRFEIDKKDRSIAFRGSSNQNIWEKCEDGKFVLSKLN